MRHVGKRSVPRFSRRFYEVGSALRGQQSLASLGSQAGPFAVAFEGLSRIGDSLLKQGQNEQKRKALADADREGMEETEAAFRENRMVQLRQDETLSAQAYNKSVQASYLARLDTSIQGISQFQQARNPQDAGKFTQAFDADAGKLLANVPPEMQATVRMELIKNKGRVLNAINVEVVKQGGLQAQNELLGKMDESSGKWKESIRLSYMFDEDDPRFEQAMADGAEAQAKFIGALDSLFGVTPEAKAKAMVKVEKDTREEHVRGAFGRAVRAGHGEKFINEFAKSTLENDGFEPGGRRRMVKVMEAANAQIAEQSTLVQSQAIADEVMQNEELDTEAKALAFVRKTYEGKVEKAAVAQVKGRFADKAKADTVATETLWTQLEAGVASGATAAQLAEIKNQAPTRAARKAMEEYIDNQIERKEPETNWAEYDRLLNLTQEALVEEDIYAARNKLSDAEFKDIEHRKARFREALAKGQDLTEPGTLTQQLSATTNSFSWSGAQNAAKRGRFANKVRATINAEQQRLDKELTYDERQTIIERLSKSVFVDDWFGDTKLPAGALDETSIGDDRVYVPINKIDDATAKDARAALVQMGVDDSDDNIEELVAAERRNGQRGVTEWFRSMGAEGLK